MNPYAALVLVGLTVLAQRTLVPALALGGTKPFLPLLMVVSWGLLRGPLAGLGLALALGALLDVASPAPFGYYTLGLAAVAAVVAASHGRIFAHNLLLPGLVAAVSALVFLGTQLAPFVMSPAPLAWDRASLATLAAKSVLLALLWLPLVYVPLRYVARRAAGPRVDWER